MSRLAAIVRCMQAMGASPEMVAAVVEVATKPKTTSAERMARKRESDKKTVTSVTSVTSVTPTPLDVPPSPSLASHPQPPLNPPFPKISARDELLLVLDEERASAVIEHRQRIRKPLTAHAAKLLAGKMAKCPDPNAAADAMISNGWQGFEADWLDNRRGGAGPPQRAGNGTGFNGKETLGDILNAARAQIAAKDTQNGRPVLELVALPDRRGGDGRGDNAPPDGLPGSPGRSERASDDLLRRIRGTGNGPH